MSLFAPDPAAVLAERRRILREVVLRGGMKPPANPDRVAETAITDLDRDALAWEDNSNILRPHVDADEAAEHDILVGARVILFELEGAAGSLPMDTLIAKAERLRIPPDTFKASVTWLREADLCKLNSGVLRDVSGDKGRKGRVQLGDDLFTLRRPLPAPAPKPEPVPAPAPAPAPAWTLVTPPKPEPVAPEKPVAPVPAAVTDPEPVAAPKPVAPPKPDPAYAADVAKTEPPKPAPVSRPASAPEAFPFDLNEIGEELRGIRQALELPFVASRAPAHQSPAIDAARRVCTLLHALGPLTKVTLDNRLSRAQRKQLDAALELLVRRDAVVLTGSVLRGGTYTLVNPTPVGLSWELLDHAASKVKGHRREFAVTRGT